jgi:hygromycin-B 7''-O-kinase
VTANALIPRLADEAAYRAVFADEQVWQRPMQVLAARHGVDPAQLRRETLGSHIVYGTDTVIVKLFYSGWCHDFAAERAALLHAGELPVPRIIAEGELEGWPYMVLSRLAGVPAGTVWDQMDREDQLGLMAQAGALIRRLHDLSPAPGLATDWDAFLAARFRHAPAHHALAAPWQSWIEARLRTFDASSPTLVTRLMAGGLWA